MSNFDDGDVLLTIFDQMTKNEILLVDLESRRQQSNVKFT
jgi:hypothetical protein